MPTPRFRNEVKVSPYPDGRTWYLLSKLQYDRENDSIVVPKGFETDFASVPGIFTNVFPRWDDYGPASIVHDWLYWSQPMDRISADDVFLEAMIVLSVPSWKRLCLYRSVRIFGQSAWDSNAKIGTEGYSRIHTGQTHGIPRWRQFRDFKEGRSC